jgi:hypothetical protein
MYLSSRVLCAVPTSSLPCILAVEAAEPFVIDGGKAGRCFLQPVVDFAVKTRNCSETLS